MLPVVINVRDSSVRDCHKRIYMGLMAIGQILKERTNYSRLIMSDWTVAQAHCPAYLDRLKLALLAVKRSGDA